MPERPGAYAFAAGEGWTYSHGIDFVVKARETGSDMGVAVLEYVTKKGEEPRDHTHQTEDEMFYVLEGALTFRCRDESFDIDEGGFVFLPYGVTHGYTIRSDGDVRLLVVTSPPREASGGWDGFVGDMERT